MTLSRLKPLTIRWYLLKRLVNGLIKISHFIYILSTFGEFEVNDTRLFYLSNNEINIMRLSECVLEKKFQFSQFAIVNSGLNTVKIPILQLFRVKTVQ